MSKEVLFEGKFRRFVVKDGWEFTERTNSTGIVVIIPVTDQNEVVLVEQFRVPVGKPVIEYPAGLVHDQEEYQHESYEETAKRELIEETGFDAESIVYVTEGPSCSAAATDMLSIYHATGLKQVGPGGGDETENITVHIVPLDTTEDWIQSQIEEGKIVDPKIYAGLYYLRHMA